MPKPSAEDQRAYEEWLARQQTSGQTTLDPNLQERWKQKLDEETAAYARGERPLVSVMEEEGAGTRGSWQKVGTGEKPLAETAELKKKLYVMVREFIVKLLENGFFDSHKTIKEAEAKLERTLMDLEAKQHGFGELPEQEQALLEILSFLQVQIPLLKSDGVVADETVLFEVPDDLDRKITAI